MLYAPPGAALSVYCGMKVPPALMETVPWKKQLQKLPALAKALEATVELAVVAKNVCGVAFIPDANVAPLQFAMPPYIILLSVAVPPKPDATV